MKVEIGDVFEVSFSGSGIQTGARYEVYHITGRNSKNIPTNPSDELVSLKLTSRAFFQSGAAFTLTVPAAHLTEFFNPRLK